MPNEFTQNAPCYFYGLKNPMIGIRQMYWQRCMAPDLLQTFHIV